jgi:predicted DNA-binding transcriptional regulator AlpA
MLPHVHNAGAAQMTDSKAKKWKTARQVRERYGDCSHMWIARRLESDPDFPRPVKFNRLRMWDEAELDAYDRICAARGRGDEREDARDAKTNR